jgi:thiopeptide-type bacteriocin biosynthesis protein
MTASPDWIQIDCSLFPGFDGGPYLPWGSLSEAVAQWRAEELFQWFWFVRKMPGLKLRFGGRELGARLQAPLARWLRAAERTNEIRGFRFTIYEPETYRFGGEAGMAVAHAHFDAGARLVLGYETLPAQTRERVSRLTLSLTNTSDLLIRSLSDRAEIWDVWRRLHAALESLGPVTPPPAREDWGGVFHGFDSLGSVTDPGLKSLAAMARAGNTATAEALQALAESGVLSLGRRAWLTAASIFEWNRFGLPEDRPALASAVAGAILEHLPDGDDR